MSKRSATSSPTKAKKRKLEENQQRLDTFFKSPQPKRPDNVKTNNDSYATSSSPTRVQGPSRLASSKSEASSSIIVIDSDSDDHVEPSVKHGAAIPSDAHPISIPVPSNTSHTLIFGKSKTSGSSNVPIRFPDLAVDPLEYSIPSIADNGARAPAPYSLLTHAFVTLSQTRSRIAIVSTIANLLRTIISLYPTSLLPTVYLLSNSLKPSFIPLELGLGSSIISKSIQQVSGLSPAAVRKLYTSTGDPGDVAFEAKVNLRTLIPHPPLTIPGVYQSLIKIASCRGQGAGKEKQKIVEKLLLAASGEEVRYLTRTLFQNLRVGAVRTSILTALARAMVLTPNRNSPLHANVELLSKAKPSKEDDAYQQLRTLYVQAESIIKEVYVRHPSYEEIIPALLQGGLDDLNTRVPLTVGIPLLPMLGSPTRSLHEIYERLGNLPFTAEFKYDGQRAQVHANRGSSNEVIARIFSRHLEDMTNKYPDVTSLVETMLQTSPGLTSFIMDAEIVAIEPLTSQLKSFQELSNRPRKDVNLADVRISVCLFAFDLMYMNGQNLLGHTFRERRNALRQTFHRRRDHDESIVMAQFDFVESCDSEGGKEVIEDFFAKAVESKCEGLMIKLLDQAPSEEGNGKQGRSKSLPATYQPDIRTSAWLKLKKDYVEGLSDSIDVIPIGAWHGNGRKAQWWSPVLLALWDSERGLPVAVCKCMSGFTDTFYKALTERYSLGNDDMCSRQSQWECDFGGFKPDVYFNPHEVWEIRGADITESPISTAAKGLIASRGLSIRFPRFIRVRDDKGNEQASGPMLLVDLWKAQSGKGKAPAGNDDGDLIDATFEGSDVELESVDEYESEEPDDPIG